MRSPFLNYGLNQADFEKRNHNISCDIKSYISDDDVVMCDLFIP